MLATEPATPHQRGAVLREFERLGFDEAGRAERLAVCAALLGLDELGSTTELVMGQAGQLVNMLQRVRYRAELPAAAAAAVADDHAEAVRADADDGQGDEHASEEQPPATRLTLAEVVARMIARWLAPPAGSATELRSDAPVGEPDPGHAQDRKL